MCSSNSGEYRTYKSLTPPNDLLQIYEDANAPLDQTNKMGHYNMKSKRDVTGMCMCCKEVWVCFVCVNDA